MINPLHWLLSFFTPVSTGYGTTADPTVQFSEETLHEHILEEHLTHLTFYEVNPQAGAFELVGIQRRGKTVMYKLHHSASGHEFTVSKRFFDLLFKASPLPLNLDRVLRKTP
jgi:hypothetical protein